MKTACSGFVSTQDSQLIESRNWFLRGTIVSSGMWDGSQLVGAEGGQTGEGHEWTLGELHTLFVCTVTSNNVLTVFQTVKAGASVRVVVLEGKRVSPFFVQERQSALHSWPSGQQCFPSEQATPCQGLRNNLINVINSTLYLILFY